MKVHFRKKQLDRLEAEAAYDAGFPQEVARAFRMRMQMIRAALDERDFRMQRSLRFEKMKGKRAHQYSMRLNDQWRLILEIGEQTREKVITVVDIEDYH